MNAAPLLLLAALAHADPGALADRAVAENPGLAAMQSEAMALSERAAVAGSWSDPVLMLEASNLPPLDPVLGAHPMAGLQLRVQQGLHPRGWSAAQRDVVEGQAEVVRLEADEAALQLRAAVHRTWWLLARSRALEAVTRAHLARTEELLGAATARYQTGSAGQHGVLRLTVLRDQLADDLGDFVRTEAELHAALSAALGGSAPGTQDTPAAPDPLPPPPSQDWAATASAHRPAVAAERARAEAAGRAGTLARIDARPDVQLWAGYRLRAEQTMTADPGTDLVSLGVGVPVPTGSRRRADGAEAAAAAQARAAQARAIGVEAQAAAHAAAAHARWTRAAAKTATLDATLLPGARATLDTTRGDFGVGRADFASLFEAEVALLRLERARIHAAVDTHLAHAELTAALGTDPAAP